MVPKLPIANWISVILVIDCVFCQLNPDSGAEKLEVAIAFDRNPDSKTFFKNELNPIFDDISKCVKWNFVPISTTDCTCSTEECQIEAIHACAAHYFRFDNLGAFFSCTMGKDDKMTDAENCAKEDGLDWRQLQRCQSCEEGGKLCARELDYLSLLTHQTLVNIPVVIFNRQYNAASRNDALRNLKDTICKKIKERNLQCAAC